MWGLLIARELGESLQRGYGGVRPTAPESFANRCLRCPGPGDVAPRCNDRAQHGAPLQDGASVVFTWHVEQHVRPYAKPTGFARPCSGMPRVTQGEARDLAQASGLQAACGGGVLCSFLGARPRARRHSTFACRARNHGVPGQACATPFGALDLAHGDACEPRTQTAAGDPPAAQPVLHQATCPMWVVPVPARANSRTRGLASSAWPSANKMRRGT